MRPVTFLRLCLVALLASFPLSSAKAERLNEASIRHMYDESAAAIRDPDQTRLLMEERLDDSFTLKTNQIIALSDGRGQSSSRVLDKAGTMDEEILSGRTTEIEDYHHTILNIQFSDDKKFADVRDATLSSGLIKMETAEGQKKSAKFGASQECLDLVTLKDQTLTILKSAGSK